MMKRLIANLKLWAKALEGSDNPLGDYLLRLESRIRVLENAGRDHPFDLSDPPRGP